MNHLTAESSLPRPTFRSASADILSGRLRMLCDLDEDEYERGRTDCAIVTLDMTIPHCLAIVVLRGRRISVVGSFQADAPFQISAPDDLVPFQGSPLAVLEDAPVHELLRRVEASMRGDVVETIVTVNEREFALALLKAFNREDMAA